VGIRFPAEATHFARPEDPDRFSDHSASYIMNINGSFPSCKAARLDAKHSPLSSREAVNRPTRGHSVLLSIHIRGGNLRDIRQILQPNNQTQDTVFFIPFRYE